MNKLRLIICSLAVAVFGVVTLAPVVSAQGNSDLFEDVCQSDPTAAVCVDRAKPASQSDNVVFGPSGILTRAAQIITIAVGVASVIMIVIGGIKYTLSAGDSNSVNSAKNTVIYALVGIGVALSAQAIIVFVLRKI